MASRIADGRGREQPGDRVEVPQQHLVGTGVEARLAQRDRVVQVHDVGAEARHRPDGPAGVAADVQAHPGAHRVDGVDEASLVRQHDLA